MLKTQDKSKLFTRLFPTHFNITIKRTKKSCQQQTGSKIYVVVQLYPWFKFIFFLFKLIIIHYHTQKQKEIKFQPG